VTDQPIFATLTLTLNKPICCSHGAVTVCRAVPNNGNVRIEQLKNKTPDGENVSLVRRECF